MRCYPVPKQRYLCVDLNLYHISQNVKHGGLAQKSENALILS
jgi:hypothetical protein